MQLKRIKVSNFRSFDEIDVELGRFNVLIGANASGKSNFINVFRFLKDIDAFGLKDAVSLQGGVEYLRNVNIGTSKNLKIELHIDFKDDPFAIGLSSGEDYRKKRTLVDAYEFMYSFSIEFSTQKEDYTVTEEKAIFNCDFIEMEFAKEEKEGEKGIGKRRIVEETNGIIGDKVIEERKICEESKSVKGKLIIIRERNKIRYDLDPKDLPIRLGDIYPVELLKKEVVTIQSLIPPTELFLKKVILSSYTFLRLKQFFTDISVYYLDPQITKISPSIAGKTELESNGENLPLVLKKLFEDEKKRQNFRRILKDLLPFIEEITVEKMTDKVLDTRLREIYSIHKSLPASLMSEGTLIIVALIIVLYFEKKPLVIIEEPENHIHPYLISKVIDMIKDVSEWKDKQIIATTHNPEVVRYGGVKNLLLVHRDDKGFSKISRPSEKKEVQIFLKNKMGVAELYVQNLLKW